jgi:hypothetical protein
MTQAVPAEVSAQLSTPQTSFTQVHGGALGLPVVLLVVVPEVLLPEVLVPDVVEPRLEPLVVVPLEPPVVEPLLEAPLVALLTLLPPVEVAP